MPEIKTAKLNVRVTEEFKEAVDQAAAAAGLAPADWMRQVMSLAISEGWFRLPASRRASARGRTKPRRSG